jgi:hypothetical protein
MPARYARVIKLIMRMLLLLLIILAILIGGPATLAFAATRSDTQDYDGSQSFPSRLANEGIKVALEAPRLPVRLGISCETAIGNAERRYGIPTGLLRAIGEVESGRPVSPTGRIEPWPWTADAQGHGVYFGTKAMALVWVRQQQSAGIQSIDIGCLQVNLVQHPDAFRSLEEAFEPSINADYAARFLVQLYHAAGTWVTAAGFYHSQTSNLAAEYRERVRVAYQASPVSRCSAPLNGSRNAWAATLSQEAGRSLFKPVQFPRRPLAPVVSVVYRTPAAGCGRTDGLIPPTRTPYSLTPAMGFDVRANRPN